MTREKMLEECVTPNEEVFKMCDKHYKDGYNQALEKIKDASVIFDGEKIYGSNTKVILITEEKYNEIFNK